MAKKPAGGRKPKISEALRAKIVAALTSKSHPMTVKQIAVKFDVPVSTLYYHIGPRRDLVAVG